MFSVVIPTYNRAYCIAETIQSVLDQSTDFPFEIIVVDDGSVDDTKKRIIELSQSNASVVYVSQQNAGASTARNTGIVHATYDWVVFLDSDDRMYPTFFDTIATVIQKGTVVFGTVNHQRQIVLLDGAGTVIDALEPTIVAEGPVSLQDYYHWKIKTTSSGVFYNKHVCPDIFWDTNLHYIEDLDFLMQLGEIHPEGFAFVEKPLLEYTQSYGGDGMCSNAQYQDWADAFDYIYKKHAHDPLMQGQDWWPQRVEKYTLLQQEVDRGEHEPQMYKYFPQKKHD